MKRNIQLKEVVIDQDEFDRLEDQIKGYEDKIQKYEEAKCIIIEKIITRRSREYTNETSTTVATLSESAIIKNLADLVRKNERLESRRKTLKEYLRIFSGRYSNRMQVIDNLNTEVSEFKAEHERLVETSRGNERLFIIISVAALCIATLIGWHFWPNRV